MSGGSGDEPQRPPPEASGPQYSLENVAPELADQEKLAQRVGVRVRTVYRYYPSKLAILTELVFRLNETLNNEYGGPMSLLADPRRDWRELQDLWIDRQLDFVREVPGARLMLGAAEGYPELLELQDRMYDHLAQELEAALRARGLELPAAQMRALCRSMPEVFDRLTLVVHKAEGEQADALRAEMKRWILGYLSQYLD